MKKELTSLLIKEICKGKTCEKCKYIKIRKERCKES